MILPNGWAEFMSTHDLPLYGQVLAYGFGAAAIAFAFRQLVCGIRAFFETFFWVMDRIKDRQDG